MKLFKQFFSKGEQKQQEPLFFDPLNQKIDQLERQLKMISDGMSLGHYPQELVSHIDSNLQDLKKYILTTKIYIVLLGTTSAGKSTFINSLVGQQILPSRNQECTKNLIFITNNENIQINGNAINNIDEAQSILDKMEGNQIIDLQLPSYFHQQFPIDLRSRIILVDTPGIKHCQQKSLEKHFQDIDDRLNGHHRINIWVSNYTTFDNDKELQGQIIKLFQPPQTSPTNSYRHPKNPSYLESVIIEEFQTVQQQQKCLLVSSNSVLNSNETLNSVNLSMMPKLFFILNKYDERKVSEDTNIDIILQDISKQIGNQNMIFKISALRSMRYRILNFGNKQAVDRFIRCYHQDYKDIQQFKTLEDCRKFCEKTFKNNENIMQNQDYQKLNDQLSYSIQTQISQTFFGETLYSSVLSLILLEMVINPEQIRIDQKQFDLLKEMITYFFKTLILNYENQINQFKIDALFDIKAKFREFKTQIVSTDSQELILSACQQAQIILSEYETKILKLNQQIKIAVIDKLQCIFPTNDLFCSFEIIGKCKDLTIFDGCIQLFELLSENNISEISKQSFKQFSENAKSLIGIKIYPKACLVSSGITIAAYLGRGFALQSLLSTPIFAAFGLGLVVLDLQYMFTKSWYSENIIETKLNDFESSLAQQIENLQKNYQQTNQLVLMSIKNLLNRLIKG